ncbi:hypothetical protein HDU79_012075, partial [Rhizoclosmatium sp. JEL0117]
MIAVWLISWPVWTKTTEPLTHNFKKFAAIKENKKLSFELAAVAPAESLPDGWMKAVKIAVLDITYGPNNIRYDSFLSRMRNLQEPLKSQIQRLKRGSDAHVSYTCHASRVFSVKNDGTYLVA